VLLPLFMLAACSGADKEAAVSVSVIGPRAELVDPNVRPLDPPSATLLGATMQGLVSFDARGEVEPALAERWIVTDDGTSYVFRIRRTRWSNGGPVTADEVVRSLRTSLGPASRNPLKPQFDRVRSIVAMTDRIVEIQLLAPQPLLLQLLAQPEMAIQRRGKGTGPFRIHRRYPNSYVLRPNLPEGMTEDEIDEQILLDSERRLRGEPARLALARYAVGEAGLVLGGGFDDLPLVQALRPRSQEFRRDVAAGLFGFAINRSSRFLASPDIRKALAMSIDRPRLVSRFGLDSWRPLETLLPGAIGGTGQQAAPDWAALEFDQRIARARGIVSQARARSAEPPQVSIDMPTGPGGRLMFAQIKADWATIGVTAVRARNRASADLRLIDRTAPVNTVDWYLTQIDCARGMLCSAEATAAIAGAARATDTASRTIAFARADGLLAEGQYFIPLAVPVRWSLASTSLGGFRDNPFGIHPLNRLRNPTG
jgi:peptide/nickel transport system substrate-binding protein